MPDSFESSTFTQASPSIRINSNALTDYSKQILQPQALDLLTELHRQFNPERLTLLASREQAQAEFNSGRLPAYEPRDSEMVTGDWKVAEIPADLLCRRVEITGPVNSAKMVIKMLSRNEDGARADCAMLDFEDSLKPSWKNVIDGFHNVIGAAKGELSVSQDGKDYHLNPDDMAVLMVRCRGLHLVESNILIDDEPVSAGLFDLALCFYHTARTLVDLGKTPKYYVPKCEHHLEARWWEKLFCVLEDKMNLPRSTLRATFLIETLTGAFQIEEILYEIRLHAAGLNVGRWDKIFSDIKTLKFHSDRIMSDRSLIGMQSPWMRDYAKRLIDICHSRGAFAMGGMAAFTPGRDPELRKEQVAKVKEDKAFEAKIGHDGCWVSHPFFIGIAQAEFTEKNQLNVFTDLNDKYPNLLPQGGGNITEAGLRKNIRVGIAYMHGWLNDIGCVAWDNLMEDLATLEISRAQVWQWLHHGISLDEGQKVTQGYIEDIFSEEFEKIQEELVPQGKELENWILAEQTARELFLARDFPEFLTTTSELV
jgi:malate synthase